MAKLNMKKVDFKKLLIEKGERVGLGVAGALCVLMFVPMFWFVLFGPSTKKIVEELNKPAGDLKSKQASSTPGPGDKPPPADTSAVVLQREKVDGSKYPFAVLFTPSVQEDTTKRQMPRVLTPIEGRVEVTSVQLETVYMVGDGSPDNTKAMKLLGSENGPGPSGTGNADMKQKSNPYGSGGGGGRGGRGGSPGNGYPRSPYQSTNQGGVGHENKGQDLKYDMIKLADITDLDADHIADAVMPVRMAIIYASFPYKRQVEEFKNRLHLQTNRQVVDETTEVTTDKGTITRPTFFFIIPVVERREVDVHGKPLAAWKQLDIEGDYRSLLWYNGLRFVDDTEAIDEVSFDGLVMNKMKVMGKNQYPDGESRLTTLQAALAKLKPDEEIVKPKVVLDPSGFDVTAKRQAKTSKSNPMPGVGPKLPPKTSGLPKTSTPPGMPPIPGTNVTPGTGDALSDCCLIRLIDVKVEPGKFYQYRLKVRMENPNFGMKNVASPAYAVRTEPLESDWYEVRTKPELPPQVVAVPSEYHLYTVDQQEIDYYDGKKYAGQNANVQKDRQVALQIHKWLEEVKARDADFKIGEWSIAERVLAYRGEYIGRKQRIEVPYWRPTMEMFVMAQDTTLTDKRIKGLLLDFSPTAPEGTPADPPYYSILVDFEGGSMQHSRVTGKGKDGKDEVYHFEERAGVETLILSPEGKLLAQDSWTDKADQERVKRLNAWHDRIKEVKEGKAKGEEKNPFGTDKNPMPKPPPMKN